MAPASHKGDMSVEPPDSSLRKVINRHGHAFQNAVLRHSGELFNAQRSRWIFDAAEVPVEVRGVSTRIDFVLRQLDWGRRHTAKYLVGECKRANPALSHWCFAKMPFIRRDEHQGALVWDEVLAAGFDVSVEASTKGHSDGVYGLAYELRTDSKGEGAPGRGAIEEACGQVIRGVKGLLELLRSTPELLTVNQPTPVVPVIFTTATLWATDTDLAMADLHTGELPHSPIGLKRVPWLWLRYHSSPSLLADLERPSRVPSDLGSLVEAMYVRCIAIVSPAGIADFLSREAW